MKVKTVAGLVFCSFLMAAQLIAASKSMALEIFYPADGTYVESSDYLIIKGGEAPQLDGMIVEMNGVASDLIDISSAEYQAAFKDLLILQPSFDPGENNIKVTGYREGKAVVTADATIFYQTDPLAQVPGGYERFVMHVAEKEAKCAACHNMNPDKVELNQPDPATNPCASCHRRMLNKKHVHGPAGVFRCASCHDAGSSPQKYQISMDGKELCGRCHARQMKDFNSRPVIHGPVEVGLCLVCHDAHAEEYPAQVRGPVNELCLDCHEVVAKESHVSRGVTGRSHPLSGRPDPSVAGKDLSCASCHDPHGGQARYMFQRGITGRFSLCGMCHKK